jgi:hypothetical protein
MTQAAPTMVPSRPLLGWVDVATWLAFIATWLYTADWSFAYHYFDRFHVGLLALEIPKEDYFLYSFWVLQDHWGWAVVSYLMGMGYLVLRRYVAGAVWRRWETPVVNGLVPVLGLLLVWSGYQLGGGSADNVLPHNNSTTIRRILVCRCG